ncbi:MAG: hypothetical protein JWO46_3000 [Nocardioidaceae bacterium]|nr:hypothetical protein [Nocardioidaceae bacterium]
MIRSLRYVVPALVAALTLAGCSGSDDPRPKADTPASTASSAPPTPKQSVPTVGECYRLDFDAATKPTSTEAAVPCTQPHTAQTVFVGTLDTVDDGHLLAVDSSEVQQQLAATCPTKLPAWLGGDQDTLRLSRFQSIWFSPSITDADAGATWYRCDVVAVQGQAALADLPARTKGVLGGEGVLDTFGTCGNVSPASKKFQRTICSQPHGWQAVSVFEIPPDATYLGKQPYADADDACKLEAQQRASDPLVYRWSVEWPTQDEWNAGRRYSLCWVPAKGPKP